MSTIIEFLITYFLPAILYNSRHITDKLILPNYQCSLNNNVSNCVCLYYECNGTTSYKNCLDLVMQSNVQNN